MPFDPELDSIFVELIQPSLQSAGFDVYRADSFASQTNILQTIVRMISESQLVVADLTSLNPNVLYELGIAHALQKPTVLLTQNVEEVPFDLRSYLLTPYSVHFVDAGKLRLRLTDIAEKFLAGDLEYSNPVMDYAGKGAVTLQHDQNSEGIPEAEPPGFLDHIKAGMSAAEPLAVVIQNVADLTKRHGDFIRQKSARLTSVVATPSPTAISDMDAVTKQIAGNMSKYARDLNEENSTYDALCNRFVDGFVGVARFMAKHSSSEQKEEITAGVAGLLGQSEGARRQFASLTETVEQLPDISREISRARKLEVQALSQFVGITDKLISACNQILKLLDEGAAEQGIQIQ